MGSETANVLEIAVANKNNFLRLISDEKLDWEHCRSHKGITISRIMPDKCDIVNGYREDEEHGHHHTAKGHIFKGEAIFDDKLDVVAKTVHPAGPYRIQWDSHLMGLKVLDKINENTLIVYHAAKPLLMGIISKRDSVDVLHVDSLSPTNKFIAFCSIYYSDCPPVEHFVRAWSYTCGTMMDAVEDGAKTRVRILFGADYNMPQMVPVSLMDAGMPKELTHFLQRFRDAPKKLNVTEEKLDLQGWN